MPLLICLFCLLALGDPATAAGGYAVAILPTPVFNTADLRGVFGGASGTTLQLDRCGQLRALEFVALPGTPFTIEETLSGEGGTVYRVTTADYPYPNGNGYFVDSRFVRLAAEPTPARPRRLPGRETVIARLLAAEGSRYVWGGNRREGIAELMSFFPPAPGSRLDGESSARWRLAGVDCSGLLYEATDGFTPRNTRALVDYGEGVPIAGQGAAAIIRLVEPLDLITWPGHVLIVLDRERVIESRLACGKGKGGVTVRPLAEAVAGIMKQRRPVDHLSREEAKRRREFVIRRWYGGVEGRADSALP